MVLPDKSSTLFPGALRKFGQHAYFVTGNSERTFTPPRTVCATCSYSDFSPHRGIRDNLVRAVAPVLLFYSALKRMSRRTNVTHRIPSYKRRKISPISRPARTQRQRRAGVRTRPTSSRTAIRPRKVMGHNSSRTISRNRPPRKRALTRRSHTSNRYRGPASRETRTGLSLFRSRRRAPRSRRLFRRHNTNSRYVGRMVAIAPPAPLPPDVTVRNGDGTWKWPVEMHNTFVISIRSHRWLSMRKRFGPWAKYLRHWPGTNGSIVNKNQYRQSGKLQNPNLRRGEIGCYDSHHRIWKHMVAHNLATAFIMEDDAAIFYNKEFAKRLHAVWGTLRKNHIPWDIFYMGRNRPDRNIRSLGPGIARPLTCQGCFAYMLTLAGAKKLLASALPMRQAVDVFAGKLGDTGRITAIAMYPRLCYVVSVRSDTRGII